MIRKIIRSIGKALLVFAGLVSLYFLSAYCLSRITINKDVIGKKEVTIYIKTNGVHTDIVVPVRNEIMDWSREVKFSNTTSKDSTFKYLAMGWGNREFYLETPDWSDLKLSTAFKAMFALDGTALHTTFYYYLTEDETCRKIVISREQYKSLVDYITKTFQKDGDGHFMHIATNVHYEETDAFYEANGRYSLFNTCNTWANGALKVAGQKCCLWTIFDTGIFEKYK
jgi:uncharacterized protein (TIGR02117 family)